MRCSVDICANDTKTVNKRFGITFHMFPTEPKLRSMWVAALGIKDWEPRERSTICSEHFREQDFYKTKSGLRKIKTGAIPMVSKEFNDELDEPALTRVCRICLTTDVKMYDFRDYNLDDVYEQITGMMVVGAERLPQRVCIECAARLTAALRFRNRALRSLELLQEFLLDDDYVITLRDIATLNYVHESFKSPLIQTIFDNSHYDLHIRDTFVKDGDVESKDKGVSAEDNGLNCEEDDAEKTGLDGEEDEARELEPNGETEELDETELSSEDVKNEEDAGVDFELEDTFEDSTYNIQYEERAHSEDNDGDVSSGDVLIQQTIDKKKSKKNNIAVNHNINNGSKSENDVLRSITERYKEIKVKRPPADLDTTLFTITPLSYEQQIEEVAQRQHSASYINSPYKCTICYRGYEEKISFETHMLRHSKKYGMFECFVCKTRLRTRNALRHHLTARHTEQYSCNGCTFITKNRGVAKEHEKWHAGTKYQCPHCYEVFDKRSTYLGHIRIKHVSDFVCELCGYTFVNQKGIEVHKQRKHVLDYSLPLEGPYCEVCEVRFISEEVYDRHLMLSSRHSSDSDPNRIRNSFQSMNRIPRGHHKSRIHRRPVIHRSQPPDDFDLDAPINCEQCDLQLSDLRSYAQHFRRAHPDKNRTKFPTKRTPCMCELCGKIFRMMSLLEAHMWVHTGQKRYKCEFCNKTFVNKQYLVEHMKSHGDKKPSYECPLCGKLFTRGNNRKRHMFLHTGLKPFKCDVCGKLSTSFGEHKIHYEHVHLKKPWPKRTKNKRGSRPDDASD